MNVHEALGAVQIKLKAPKNQTNKFGGYNYRSCEDILEAVKPLLHDAGASLAISDEVLMVGERYYVVATAVFTYDGESVAVQAYAREQEERKGMDASQVTGSASSYARKYALNGLFLIDDTRDADATQGDETPSKAPKQRRSKKGTDKGGTEPQAAPDGLKAAKAALFAAVKDYAARFGYDPQAIAAGIRERPDYEDNKENAEWYQHVREEFE